MTNSHLRMHHVGRLSLLLFQSSMPMYLSMADILPQHLEHLQPPHQVLCSIPFFQLRDLLHPSMADA